MKKTTDHYDRVCAFMAKFSQVIRTGPEMPTEGERLLRAKLILEEALETITKGLGIKVAIHDYHSHMEWQVSPLVSGDELQFKVIGPGDLVELADGCADIMVVTTGTLIAAGIPDKPLQELVDQNNLDKLRPGHIIRDDGKLIKPPDHKPPDIEGLLKELKYGD